MNKKQEVLVNLLKSVSLALKYYIEDGVCRAEEFMWYEVLVGKLEILEAFGDVPEAQEAVKLIRGLIARIDKTGESGWLLDFPTKVYNIERAIIEGTDDLISKIEQPEPLKVEAGAYEMTYAITGRGGVRIEIEEGEEAVDVLEIYLLDSGMNLDDREVTITGIKKIEASE